MNKIAIFVEGQTELIFTREYLNLLYCYNVSINCLKLQAGNTTPVPYSYNPPNAEYEFYIYMVQNDVKVLSAMKEKESILYKQGFSKVIGLRDMYSRSIKI